MSAAIAPSTSWRRFAKPFPRARPGTGRRSAVDQIRPHAVSDGSGHGVGSKRSRRTFHVRFDVPQGGRRTERPSLALADASKRLRLSLLVQEPRYARPRPPAPRVLAALRAASPAGAFDNTQQSRGRPAAAVDRVQRLVIGRRSVLSWCRNRTPEPRRASGTHTGTHKLRRRWQTPPTGGCSEGLF